MVKTWLKHHHCNERPFDSEAGLSATELGIQNETESCCLVLLVEIYWVWLVYDLVGIFCVEACGKMYDIL